MVACAHPDPSSDAQIEVRPGDTLETISVRRYGHQAYRHVISVFNHLGPPESLQVGVRLRTPDLQDALLAECADPSLAPAIEAICCARAKFASVGPSLHQLTSDYRQRPVVLPDEVADVLRDAHADVERAITCLKAAEHPPRRVVARLEEVSFSLFGFTRGDFDAYGYDTDLVDRRLAAAMSNLIVWARRGYQ